jgi:hypothetical protein
MAPIRVLTMGAGSALADDARFAGLVADLDLYRLPDADLAGGRALLLGPHVDQLFLAAHGRVLDGFLRLGGRLVVCAQVVRPFAPGLPLFVPVRYRGVPDLTVHRLADHPVWRGVRTHDLTFRRGVAGFYGRGYYPGLPTGALVVHGLGTPPLPLDAVYPVGAGEVLLHGGNDLWGYAGEDTSAARMAPQLVDWLLAGRG